MVREVIPCIGVGGPFGSGKTALIEAMVPMMIRRGLQPLVITNEMYTGEAAEHVRRPPPGLFEPHRVWGVETGTCSHTAVREDPCMKLPAVEELVGRYPDADLIFIESGGDDLTLTFSPALADYQIYVIDLAARDKIPRKQGQGITESNLLVINKVDLASYVGADIQVINSDAARARAGRPFIFTNCKTGMGVDDVVEWLLRVVYRVSRS